MHLLPQLASEWNPSIRESLARLADLAHEEERWWRGHINGLAASHLRCRAGGVEIQIGRVSRTPARDPAAADPRRRWPSRKAICAAWTMRMSSRYSSSSNGREATDGCACRGRRGEALVRLDSDRPGTGQPPVPWRIPLGVPGAYVLPGGGVVHFEVARKNATLRAAALSLRRLPATLELRGWRPGDGYCPAGRAHRQKVKEMFQTARIPSWLRRDWPIVSNGSKIVWARGFGAAAEFAAGREPGPVLRVWEAEVEEGEAGSK